jgi:fructose-bisphosphate aldolase class I
VMLEGTVLKPSMVISGKGCSKQASVDEVAERTVRVLKRCVPAAVAGIAFLSGGQSDELATAHLNAMNKRYGKELPWTLTFSYGRALQAASLKAWKGASSNLAAGQGALLHRARMNGLAAQGRSSGDSERQALAA